MSICPTFRFGDPKLDRWLNRAPEFDPEIIVAVAEIVRQVRERGSEAVLENARSFDAPEMSDLFVSEKEILAAEIPEHQAAAIRTSIERVREFHQVQLDVITNDWEELERGWGWRTSATEREVTADNAPAVQLGPFKIPAPQVGSTIESGMLGQRLLPLESVGIYVPGGKAYYPSSVIMNAVPAQIAKVTDIVVATPPRRDGSIHPAILFTCRELGIKRILKCGGAAAIAAMAHGIDGLGRVDKIVGPGNKYVNEAKRQLWGAVGLDTYAGPSEVCVWALEDADPLFAAADWLTQIEHSEDNVGVVVAMSDKMAKDIIASADIQSLAAPRRETLRRALSHESCVVVVENADQAAEVINRFAPEHLSIIGAQAEGHVSRIQNAGCIAIGSFTPQSAGDYVSGPSHTLPTAGAARFGSPVNVQDFLRFSSLSMLEKEDLAMLAPVIEAFGEMEGFPTHAQGATIRLKG